MTLGFDPGQVLVGLTRIWELDWELLGLPLSSVTLDHELNN